jgi:hypothetical protein
MSMNAALKQSNPYILTAKKAICRDCGLAGHFNKSDPSCERYVVPAGIDVVIIK